MAGALRPVVLLMLLASVLFVVDGILDGAYPGGPAWFTGKLGNLAEISYVFAIVNTAVAIFVARGSERSLMARIGLSAFFLLERPLTAFVLGPKDIPAVAVHFATAVVELIILVSAVRVWRLGHSVEASAMNTLFSLDTSVPMPVPAGDRDEPAAAVGPRIAERTRWLIGVSAGLLALVLLADGVVSGFVPGGRAWGLGQETSGWLVYVFAVIVVAVAMRSLYGGGILVWRLLLATALILVIERVFSPLAMRVIDPIALVLHGLGALVALALAVGSARAIRGVRASADGNVASLEAA